MRFHLIGLQAGRVDTVVTFLRVPVPEAQDELLHNPQRLVLRQWPVALLDP